MARDLYAAGTQIYEDSDKDRFVAGFQFNEDQATSAAVVGRGLTHSTKLGRVQLVG